ncbi:MAG: gliding motility-associated C-terminal domain-containing protein [Bacteroidales bacterium]|nr:gliding motility-associated C-terminal domain-containing protein [Bacteroidales bacterium]
MSNIKDIVEQVREVPSPRCWESIAAQLPAAGAAVVGGAAATAAKSALSAGKLAAIIGSTAAVAVIVTGTTLAILKHEPKTEQQVVNQYNTKATTTDSIATEDHSLSENTLLLCQAEAEQISPAKETPVASTPTAPVPEAAPLASPIPNDQASATVSNSTTSSVANTNTPQNPIATPNTNATATSTSTPIANKSTVNSGTNAQNSNSAVSNHNSRQDNDMATSQEKEEWSFSQPIIIEIPNIFTPNGDGLNDQFVINGLENCEKKALIVKDRSGKIIFQSQNYDNSWDGSNLPNGTYYYQFSYSINNINELRQGAVLIRR